MVVWVWNPFICGWLPMGVVVDVGICVTMGMVNLWLMLMVVKIGCRPGFGL